MAAEQLGIDALLKEAHALTDANQRSNALLRAFDGIWKRNRQLLGANLDAIMGFQNDPSPNVRKLVVKIIDQVVRELPEYLHALLPHIRAMIERSDEDVALLKHVITTVASTLPATLRYMKEAPTKENKALWDALMAVIDGLAQREANASLDPASSQACHKTLEVLITLASDEKWHKPHPFLNAMTLPKLASVQLALLVTWLSTSPSESSAVHTRVASIISTVASIGVKVVKLRSDCVAALLTCEEALQQRFAAIPDVVKLPLRAGLFRLLESVTNPSSSPPQPLVDAVTRLGWADKVRALVTANTPSPQAVTDTVKSEGPAHSRPAIVEDADMNVKVEPAMGDEKPAEPTQSELFEDLCSLPLSELVTVLLSNLKHLPPEPITLDRSLALAQQSCQRMIQAGDVTQRCGGVLWPAKRDTLICTLATDPLLKTLDAAVLPDVISNPVPEDLLLFPDLLDEDRIAQVGLQDAILKYVTGDFHGRKSLIYRLFQYLYEAGLASSESGEGEEEFHIASPMLRYESLLMALLDHVKWTLPPDDPAIADIADEIPALTVNFIEAIRSFCGEPERRKNMLTLLADQAIQRTEWRDSCVDILLSFCVDPVDDLRFVAIPIVKEQLVGREYVSDRVVAFVERCLQSLSLPPAVVKHEDRVESEDVVPVSSEEGEEVRVDDGSASAKIAKLLSQGPADVMGCRHRLALYLAMCVKDNTLLSLATDAYGNMQPLFQAAFAKEMTLVGDMITKSRGIEELLKLVDGYPPSAGLLLVHLLTSAVDHTKLSRSRREAVNSVITGLRSVKDANGRAGDPRVLIPVLPILPVDEILDIFTQLWGYPPTVMLAAVERVHSVKKFPCPLPLAQLLQHILSKVPAQASGETMRVVTQALIRDTQTFHIDVLRDALDGLTSQDPLPRLAFRCLLLALETHNNTTVAVIVQTMLEKILLTRKPWADPETWRGVVILVKRLLPGSNRALCRVPVPTLLALLNNPVEAQLKTQFVAWLQLGSTVVPESVLKELKAGLGVVEQEQKPAEAVGEDDSIDTSKKRSVDEAGIDTNDPVKQEITPDDSQEVPDTKRSRRDE